MKILIISIPRSGSTSLFSSLYQNLKNYRGFCEPFNPKEEGFGDLKSQYSLNYNNLLVKVLPWDLLYNSTSSFTFIGELFKRNTLSINEIKPYIISQLIEYSSNFNQIILLSRKNIQKAAESTAHFAVKGGNFHTPYSYTPQKCIPEFVNLQRHNVDIINKLSQSIKVPITYYEDLYSGNKAYIKDFLNKNNIAINNFDVFTEYLHPKYKYRTN